MAWYDWVLWLGILYMFLGTDFTLNWLGGFAFGQRIDRNSPNFVLRIYYGVWAAILMWSWIVYRNNPVPALEPAGHEIGHGS